jgi:integrase/recombinase XerD
LNPWPPPCEGIDIDKLEEFIKIRSLSGISPRVYKEIKRILSHYIKNVNNKINKKKSLEYFTYLKDNKSISYYRKQVYQILKFLKYLGVSWTDEIILPPEPYYIPIRISQEEINETLNYFKSHSYFPRYKSLILLGCNSGLRAEELYQLKPCDINLKERIIYINHNPKDNQSTKTSRSRISFFNNETKIALEKYLNYFNDGNHLKLLYPRTRVEKQFKNTLIRVKHLRKFFSQEWDRRGGPTSIKKILMGHSMKGDVDLMHYNYQSEEDLKKIYDKVMNSSIM